MAGKLILVPTPIDEINPLEKVAFSLLDNASLNDKENHLFIIEDLRPGRRRWLRFGLTRDIVEDFTLLNEHTEAKLYNSIVDQIKKGKTAFLMSDGGLPAFYDPGQKLVNECHNRGITVTSTPFSNSTILAVALSGFNHKTFYFGGFPPIQKEERKAFLTKVLSNKETAVLMDTPYRMTRILEELITLGINKNIFLAVNLQGEEEKLYRGKASSVLSKVKGQKGEFVLVIDKLC